MQPDPLLFMARVKRPDGSWHFTRSATLAELVQETNSRLPCDIVYQFVPDGSGFSLQPVCVFTLDVRPFQPEDYQGQVRPQVEPPAPSSPSETLSGIKVEETAPSAPAREYVLEGRIPVKSQQELLAERGLEIPPEPKPTKKKRKARQVEPSITMSPDQVPEMDDDLPPPPPKGKIKITGFSDATQAERAAASRQIFK